MENSEKGPLLSPSEKSVRYPGDSGEPFLGYGPKSRTSMAKVCAIACATGLVVSIALNIYAVLQFSGIVDTGRSLYSGLTYNTPTIYHSRTGYWGDNDTLADDLWHAIDITQATIAVDDDWASQKGLPESNTFPWDSDKSLYTVKGLHDLHCVKMLRHALVGLEREGKPSMAFSHLYHCLDGLRQGVLCHADDTPMRSFEGKDHTLGEGQQLKCRNWNKMIEWAKAPERQACWTMIDDYRPIKHKLERFAYCEKDSPYYQTMSKYFEIHGHKDPFRSEEDAGME